MLQENLRISHILTNMFQFKLGSAKPDADFEQDDSDEETSQAGSK